MTLPQGNLATRTMQNAFVVPTACSTVLLACRMLLLALLVCQAQPNSTLPADVDALVGFVTGFTAVEGTVLAAWDVNADPCAGQWPGVMCSCEDLPSSIQPGCHNTANASGSLRVKGLDLGPVVSGTSRPLEGTILPALGSLSELAYLDLSNNKLSGTVPDALARLTQLQWLLLNSNQLTGLLPSYLGSLLKLHKAMLQNNKFYGSIPAGWCGGTVVYDVSNNYALCGPVPKCLVNSSRLGTIAGTYLSPTALSPDSSIGGACDLMPPDCDADVGCTIWTPKYWTSQSIVTFNFTGFMDYESGISHYDWGIGSTPSAVDVFPLTRVTADRVLKDIKYPSGGIKKMLVTPVVYNLTTLSLLEGPSYYVTVVAYNGAGPPLSTNTTSLPVKVDTSGPLPAAVYNTYNFQQASTTDMAQSLQASWDNFTDAQSGVAGYTVQFFQQARSSRNGSITLVNLTDLLELGLVNRVQAKLGQKLQEGDMYFAQVTAVNGGGLNTTVKGQPISVERSMEGAVGAGKTALIVVMCGVGCLALGALLSVLIMRSSVHQQAMREKERQQEAKQLKALMYALVSHSDMPGIQHGMGSSTLMAPPTQGADAADKEVAFVFTDIESSTELSNQDPDAFKQLQEVHDQIMREGIAKHHGYEIITEGDSFQVAFATCQAAVAFCIDIQYRLLEMTWSKDVLKLNACKAVRGSTGEILFAGPRVRMGVHWAREGTVAVRLHNLTRHKVYAGPAVQIALDVSEAAHGGQIVLSEDAVAKLSENMAMAGFPVIRLVGLYQLPSIPCPVFLFSVTEVVGKPLRRQFTSLRKIKQVWPPQSYKLPPVLEYNINLPPLPNASNCLAFVCLRLATYPKEKSKCDLPRSIQEKFEEVFAVQAQQFKGYLFQTHENSFKEGIWTVAFQSSMDAMRFTHAAQMLLMHTHWPTSAQEFCGASVPSPDGRWLFQGPRVCMAVHESSDYFVSDDDSIDPNSPRKVMSFAGPSVTLPLVLTYAGRGGQVILSESAWDSVKPVIMQHPGAVTVIGLGTHVVSEDFPKPMLLMEVMPNLLAKRAFNPIMTKRLIEPGYRDAPDPKDPMTIVFVKVSKPAEVVAAEKGNTTDAALRDEDISLIIQAYQVSVSMYAATARKLLRRYHGYECKEPEPGKFTLAFKELADAICWACHVQEQLLHLIWPSHILSMSECREVKDAEGNLIWRGLRVRMGMAYGMVSNKKPLNTGRADYFGVLANGAARVSALAAPGQVLVEAACPPFTKDRQLLLQPGQPTYLKLAYVPGSQRKGPQKAVIEVEGDSDSSDVANVGPQTVIIRAVGYFLLRGLDNPRLLYTAESFCLQSRELHVNGDMWAPAAGPYAPGGINSSFASSAGSIRRNWSCWVERTRTSLLGTKQSGSPTSRSIATLFNFAQQHVQQQRGAPLERDASVITDGSTTGSAAAAERYKLSQAAAPGNRGPGMMWGDHMPHAIHNSLRSKSATGQALSPPSRLWGSSSVNGMANNADSRAGWGGFSANGALPEPRRSKSWVSGQIGLQTAYPQQEKTQPTYVPEELLSGHTNQQHALAAAAAAAASSAAAAATTATVTAHQQQPPGGQRYASAPNLHHMQSLIADPLLHMSPIQTAMSPGSYENWPDRFSSMYKASHNSAYREVSTHSPLDGGPMTASSTDYQQQQQQQQWPVYQPSLQGLQMQDPGTMHDKESPAETPSHADLLSSQQLAQQHMQQMLYNMKDSEVSTPNSFDSRGAKGFLAGVANTFMAGSSRESQEHGTLQMILKPAQALLDRVVRRRSSPTGGYPNSRRASRAAGTHDEGNDSEGDRQLEAARLQDGMLASSTDSLVLTPMSGQTPRAYGSTSPSPGTTFASQVAQAFVNQRHNSVTSAQAIPANWGGSRGVSFVESVTSGQAGGSNTQASGSLAVAAGPEAGSRHGSYTYAAGSCSPHHFQQQGFAVWHQQEQQYLRQSKHADSDEQSIASGPLLGAYSLGEQQVVSHSSAQQLGEHLDTAAGDAASLVAAAAAAVGGNAASQDADFNSESGAAYLLSKSMWEGCEVHQLQMHQQMQAQQQQQSQQEQQQRESTAALAHQAQRPDAAFEASQAAARPGSPFLLQQHLPSSQQQQGQGGNSGQDALHGQMRQAVVKGYVVYSSTEYLDLVAEQHREREMRCMFGMLAEGQQTPPPHVLSADGANTQLDVKPMPQQDVQQQQQQQRLLQQPFSIPHEPAAAPVFRPSSPMLQHSNNSSAAASPRHDVAWQFPNNEQLSTAQQFNQQQQSLLQAVAASQRQMQQQVLQAQQQAQQHAQQQQQLQHQAAEQQAWQQQQQEQHGQLLDGRRQQSGGSRPSPLGAAARSSSGTALDMDSNAAHTSGQQCQQQQQQQQQQAVLSLGQQHWHRDAVDAAAFENMPADRSNSSSPMQSSRGEPTSSRQGTSLTMQGLSIATEAKQLAKGPGGVYAAGIYSNSHARGSSQQVQTQPPLLPRTDSMQVSLSAAPTLGTVSVDAVGGLGQSPGAGVAASRSSSMASSSRLSNPDNSSMPGSPRVQLAQVVGPNPIQGSPQSLPTTPRSVGRVGPRAGSFLAPGSSGVRPGELQQPSITPSLSPRGLQMSAAMAVTGANQPSAGPAAIAVLPKGQQHSPWASPRYVDCQIGFRRGLQHSNMSAPYAGNGSSSPVMAGVGAARQAMVDRYGQLGPPLSPRFVGGYAQPSNSDPMDTDNDDDSTEGCVYLGPASADQSGYGLAILTGSYSSSVGGGCNKSRTPTAAGSKPLDGIPELRGLEGRISDTSVETGHADAVGGNGSRNGSGVNSPRQ